MLANEIISSFIFGGYGNGDTILCSMTREQRLNSNQAGLWKLGARLKMFLKLRVKVYKC